jgi:murein DD-endopeptidase MepM/ murein hydrolase activator NlpD
VKAPDALANHALPRPRDDADNAKVAAKQLEAFFLRQLLAETRPQGGGMVDGGFAGDTFKQMLDEAIADKMSAAGGVGMAPMFARQLAKAGGAAGAAETAHAAMPTGPAEIGRPTGPTRPMGLTGPTGPIAPGIAPTGPTGPAGPAGSSRSVTLPTRAELAPRLDTSGAPHFILPVAGRPSSGYGLRADPIHGGTVNHPGFDLAAASGAEVTAAAGGTVVHAGPAGTYGNLVTLRHDNGFETRYAHLSAIDVQVGDVVPAGADLGKVGTTGYSTGPHLHFEVRHDGQAIDPAPLLPLNRSASRTTR